MQATTMLARGGIGGSPALASRDCALPASSPKKPNASRQQRRRTLHAAASSPPSAPGALLPPALRRSPVSTRALKTPGAQDPAGELLRSQKQLLRRRLASDQRAFLSPFALATAGLLSTAPAALRATDSDDPSDEDEQGQEGEDDDDDDDDDDPASELTADELAMAFSEDIKPREEEEEEEDEEEEVEDSDAAVVAAAAAASPGAEAAAADDDDDADDARALALELARVAADTKASDVVVLHVAPLVYWTSYMVLCTVYSRPQLGAVLAKAENAAAGERFGRDLGGSRGAGRSPWEVLDFGDVVMHCFTPDQREFYDLEGFYGAAEEVELPAEVSGAAGPGMAGVVGGKRDASSWANRA